MDNGTPFSYHRKITEKVICPISIVGELTILGYRDFLESSYHQMSAKCLTETVNCLVIPYKDFKDLYDKTFSFRYFIQELAKNSGMKQSSVLSAKIMHRKKIAESRIALDTKEPTTKLLDLAELSETHRQSSILLK